MHIGKINAPCVCQATHWVLESTYRGFNKEGEEVASITEHYFECYRCSRPAVFIEHVSGANIFLVYQEMDYLDEDDEYELIAGFWLNKLLPLWERYDERVALARAELERQFYNLFCRENRIQVVPFMFLTSAMYEKYAHKLSYFCIQPLYRDPLPGKQIPVPSFVPAGYAGYVNTGAFWKKVREPSSP
ncbi:MAG: hypothetical protein WDZ88_00285 [Candidatus Paceibacterota bacterium]